MHLHNIHAVREIQRMLSLKAALLGLVAAASLTAVPTSVRGQTADSILTSTEMQSTSKKEPLVLNEQGSFFAGGEVITGSDGNTFHGDHAYVQYFIPPRPKKYPIVLLHGGNHSASGWESRWDGGEGFVQLLVRQGYAVYVMDHPRRGRAGRSIKGTTIPDATPDEASTFTIFRLGVWNPPAKPQFYPGVQFPINNPEALELFFRQGTPNTGPGDVDTSAPDVDADAIVAVLNKIGPAIVVAHSAGGVETLLAATRTDKIKGIVRYESPRYVYPKKEVPKPNPPGYFTPLTVKNSEFQNLLNIPIQDVFGDYIPCGGCPDFVKWTEHVENAKDFRKYVNAKGGDVEILDLPKIGIKGNTHFMFQDMNNAEVADQLFKFFKRKGLN